MSLTTSLGRSDQQLGPGRVGQRLTVLAVSGINDHDVGARVASHELLTADLVDHHHVGFGEVGHGPNGQ